MMALRCAVNARGSLSVLGDPTKTGLASAGMRPGHKAMHFVQALIDL
jgi:hypothetical protein